MSNTIVIVLAILTSLQLCVADMTETEECIFVPLRERVDCGFDNIPMWMCEQLRDPGTNQPCCFDDGNYVGFNSLPHCFYPLQQTSVPTPTPYQPPPPNRQTSNSVQTIAAPVPTTAAVEATTLGFAPTAGLLGNTPPTGAINPFGTPPQQQRPRPNPLAAFGGQRPISLAPLTVTRATTQATNNNLPTTVRPTVERPRNLQNLLTQLGIEVDGGIPAAGQVSPGTGVLGTNVRPQTNPQPNPQPATPSKIFTQDEKNLAFCTFYKTGQLPKGLESFFEIEICDEINATATPAFANEVMQAEINRLLGQVGARPTQATSAVGASNPFAQGGNTAGQTNPLGGLLGGGNTAGLASLLGGGSTGLGGGNAGLASLLGGGGNAGLASLLGGGGSSGLSSLLGGGSSSGLSSLLGGGNSGLSSLLGGGNSGLSSLLGGGNSGLSSLLGGGGGGLASLLGGSSQNAQGSSSTSSLLSSLLLSQGLQGRPNQQASPVIGDLQPGNKSAYHFYLNM
uniref:Mucin-5AC n=1 Tax=Phallusia mammillata TaxID=59560 RepID=A0A6F9DLM1_9ASCI|nr:mucin-5AC [Phallusia mammillata]